jgi:hypothetical protein
MAAKKFVGLLKEARAMKEAGEKLDYLHGTCMTIALQCDRRGIPEEEAPSVVAVIEKAAGKALGDMTERELLKANRGLSQVFWDYLGGKKRR